VTEGWAEEVARGLKRAPREPGRPLLVVSTAGPGTWLNGATFMITFLFVGMVGAGTFLLGVSAAVPWLEPFARLGEQTATIHGAIACVIVASVVTLLVRRFAARRTGRIEFFEDRIVFSKLWWHRRRGTRVELRWDEIGAFSDLAPGHVQVYRRGADATTGSASTDLTVPTPTELYRVLVLALLDEHGVPRLKA
jgi:hypothetical protein